MQIKGVMTANQPDIMHGGDTLQVVAGGGLEPPTSGL